MATHQITRTLETSVAGANAQFPVLMLTGPRQVGKTTLLKNLCGRTPHGQPKHRYVTLDNPMLLALAQDEPALFLQRFPPLLLIDEIQHAPGLFSLIKETVDANG